MYAPNNSFKPRPLRGSACVLACSTPPFRKAVRLNSGVRCHMRAHRNLEEIAAVTTCLLLPATAMASDFSGFTYFFAGLSAILTILTGLIVYFVTKDRKSVALRSIMWGTLISLVATPVSTLNGNGASPGPPIFDFVIFAFSGDPADATASLKALAISAPCCSLVVAMLIWGRPKPSGQ